MKQDEATYTLILKYIEGKASEEETAEFLQWIDQSPENKILYFKIKDAAEALSKNENQVSAHPQVWASITEKYNREEKTDKKGIKFPKLWRYAAAIILLAGAALLYSRHDNSTWITVQVAKNEAMKKVLLPDHSQVWLKPGSSIHYPSNFVQVSRIIDLKGDGFFEVAKQLDSHGNRKSFTIKTAALSISVLGTSFNVQQHGEEEGVVVNTGVVRVETKNQVTTLHPGNRVLLKNKQLIPSNVNASLYKGWMTGNYEFNNTSIEEIRELLELTYNVTVKIDQPEQFKNIRLSGRVVAKTEQEFLELLKPMLSASIVKQQNTITIKPNRL
jgi:transmembrane sensor